MRIIETSISGLYGIESIPKEDNRGYFYRWFDKDFLLTKGIRVGEIQQANHSFNKIKGTFRGLHLQIGPAAEEKVVKCLQGSVLDIVVDLRRGSPTLMKNFTMELSAENHRSFLIPKGCAHGFITLSENVELIYLHSNLYNSESEAGISVFDPLVNISLPVQIDEISARDKQHPLLAKDFTGFEL